MDSWCSRDQSALHVVLVGVLHHIRRPRFHETSLAPTPVTLVVTLDWHIVAYAARQAGAMMLVRAADARGRGRGGVHRGGWRGSRGRFAFVASR